MKTNNFLFTFIVLLLLSKNVYSADIDDSIDDSSIDEYHEMGKIKKNINFIVLNALSRAHSKEEKNRDAVNDKYKKTSVNGVFIGAGSVVQGDIIIIDKSAGDKIAVSK